MFNGRSKILFSPFGCFNLIFSNFVRLLYRSECIIIFRYAETGINESHAGMKQVK
jgi:hypothetical protein